MPELPEVEVVRRQLVKSVVNKKIVSIDSYYDKIFNGDIKELQNTLKNKKILDIKRYGKYLVFIFKDDVLISHLRMEGKYKIKNINDPIEKHEHIVFNLDTNESLRYHDTRKFGRMDLRTKDNYLSTNPLKKLGKEPKDMKKDELYNLIKHRNIAIKTALLNQEIIAGLGNIYVDETLFLSNIHPERRTKDITKSEANKIVENAINVLDRALELGGTTIRTFSSGSMDGLFQNELLVHTKEGYDCPVCGNKIIKLKVGGRGTYVCEKCQK